MAVCLLWSVAKAGVSSGALGSGGRGGGGRCRQLWQNGQWAKGGGGDSKVTNEKRRISGGKKMVWFGYHVDMRTCGRGKGGGGGERKQPWNIHEYREGIFYQVPYTIYACTYI